MANAADAENRLSAQLAATSAVRDTNGLLKDIRRELKVLNEQIERNTNLIEQMIELMGKFLSRR